MPEAEGREIEDLALVVCWWPLVVKIHLVVLEAA